MPYKLVGFLLLPRCTPGWTRADAESSKGSVFGALVGLMVVSFAVVRNYVTQPISAVLGVAEAWACVIAATIYGAIIACTQPRSRDHDLTPQVARAADNVGCEPPQRPRRKSFQKHPIRSTFDPRNHHCLHGVVATGLDV